RTHGLFGRKALRGLPRKRRSALPRALIEPSFEVAVPVTMEHMRDAQPQVRIRLVGAQVAEDRACRRRSHSRQRAQQHAAAVASPAYPEAPEHPALFVGATDRGESGIPDTAEQRDELGIELRALRTEELTGPACRRLSGGDEPLGDALA